MTKLQFLDWDTDPAGNTDINGIGILGSNAVKNFDDAFRTAMAQLRSGVDGKVVYAAKSGNYTAVANDNNAVLRFTASATLSLTAVATLAANWHIMVIADGGDVTIDPNASETIDGATALLVPNGRAVLVVSSGSAFFTDKAAAITPKGQIYGLTLSNNASDATNDIDIAAGEAASDGTVPYLMALGSTLTKRLDAGWSVGNNQGGLDTGAVGNNKYYVWLIQRSDTGVVDALFSLSSTSPTMPTNYDRKALIGSFARVGGINYATRSYSQKEPTPWVAYTPTFVGFTGSSVQMFSRRVGDTLEVDGLFSVNSAPSATPMAFTLGFNGVDARANIDGAKLTSSRHVGTAVRDVAVAGAFYLLGTANTNFLRFSLVNSTNGGLTVQNADAITLSGQIWSVQARVPIFGW